MNKKKFFQLARELTFLGYFTSEIGSTQALDYIQIPGKLAVSATFARGMPNFISMPSRPTESYDCSIYHALPHSLTDNLRRQIMAGSFVNTTSIHETKLEALKAHQSQQHWLDASQKLNSYLQTMEDISIKVGYMSKKFKHAEGWRRHLHYGFCGPDADPLQDIGKDYFINKPYERYLENGY